MKALLLLAALTGALTLTAEKLRIVDATFAGIEPIRALAIAHALNTKTEIQIDRKEAHAALQELFQKRVDLIVIDRDQVPVQKIYPVRPYAAAVFAFYVNAGNPVRNLDIDQAREVLTAERPRWDLFPGGKKEEIHRIALRLGGTGGGVGESLLKCESFSDGMLRVGATGEGVLLTGSNPSALFAGLLLPEVPSNVRTLSVGGALPTGANALTGNYPMAKIHCVMTQTAVSPAASAFLAKFASRDFRDSIFEAGLLPVE